MRYENIALIFDGAIPQVNALLKSVDKRNVKNGYKVHMGKTPAALSMATNSNDTGNMHKASHANLHSAMKGYREYPEPADGAMVELRVLLKSLLDGTFFKTIWKAVLSFQTLSSYLQCRQLISWPARSRCFPADIWVSWVRATSRFCNIAPPS